MFSSLLRPLSARLVSLSACKRSLANYLPSMASGKLENCNFKELVTPELLRLESIFKSNGYDFRLVGGVVRDLLLGNSPKDIDIATDCTPDEMLKLFEAQGIHYIPTGLQHGTITVHMSSGVDYEVTTLRIDRITDGRHAIVDFTKDWRLDAQRRDLTINAMSVSLDGTLFDYFDGQKHLAEKKIQFVGDAKTRIEEDFLRILRYFRFYGRIAPTTDDHDVTTLQTIRETADGLRGVSVERVWMEVKRILIGNHAPHLMKLMYELKVADSIGLPPNGNLDELERVWLAMRSHGQTLQPVSLLVTLIHTPQEAHDLAIAWKLSNDEKRLGTFIAQHRKKSYHLDTPIKYYLDLLVDGAWPKSVVELLWYCGNVEMAGEVIKWLEKIPKLPVTGKELKGIGVSQGPEMGCLLKLLKDKWKDSYFAMNKDELLELAKKTRIKQAEHDESVRTKSHVVKKDSVPIISNVH